MADRQPQPDTGNTGSTATTSHADALRRFVYDCAVLFAPPHLATAVAVQFAANYDHWRATGTMAVLIEAPDNGDVEVAGLYDDRTWHLHDDGERTWYETVLPDGREGIVSQRTSGEWGWGIRGAGCLDDSSGWDTYASREDAMRAVLFPQDAADDRWYGAPRVARTRITYTIDDMLRGRAAENRDAVVEAEKQPTASSSGNHHRIGDSIVGTIDV